MIKYQNHNHSNIIQNPYYADYVKELAGRLKDYFIQKGYLDLDYRIVMITDSKGNELYYYKQDDGTLTPVIALSGEEIDYNQDGDKTKITITQRKLSMDTFNP
jgi:hypothetical protein